MSSNQPQPNLIGLGSHSLEKDIPSDACLAISLLPFPDSLSWGLYAIRKIRIVKTVTAALKIVIGKEVIDPQYSAKRCRDGGLEDMERLCLIDPHHCLGRGGGQHHI